jgi:trehalose 6-phosphate phosphatase
MMQNARASVDPRRAALFLDLDGTLIDIARRPELARPPEAMAALLKRLAEKLGGALAILSGRAIADVDKLTAPLRLPAAGVHGAERRRDPDGAVVATTPPIPADLLDEARRVAGARSGLIVEAKTYAIAMHYREAPEAAADLEPALRALVARRSNDYVLREGRRVFEIAPRAASKGAALEDFMRAPPFAGRRPIMIGDDATDESAMAAARRLGGEGWKVAGEHFPAADADFTNPAQVFSWLRALADGGSS